MDITDDRLRVLCDIACRAGEEILDVYGSDFAVALKDDDSPLTQADLRADAVIRKGLETAFPGIYILSEESVSPGGVPAGAYFLVDPLDGTKEFLKRNGEFTVNIALVRDGVATAGVVLAPAMGELFFGAQGLGAWKRVNGEMQSLRVRAADGTLRVIGSRSHGADAAAEWAARLGRPHELLSAGSSLKFCRIAEGVADLYPRLGPTSQWDTAAAQAVLEQAGGAVIDSHGRPLRYGPARPTLNPNFVAVGDRTVHLPSFQ